MAELLLMDLSSDVVRVELADALEDAGRFDEADLARDLARPIRVVGGRVAGG